jgi:hypothetical protein
MSRKKNAPNCPVQMIIGVNSLDNNRGSGGLEIRVPGFKGDPMDASEARCQIFLEYYEGKLQAHIWYGAGCDPQTIVFPRQ